MLLSFYIPSLPSIALRICLSVYCRFRQTFDKFLSCRLRCRMRDEAKRNERQWLGSSTSQASAGRSAYTSGGTKRPLKVLSWRLPTIARSFWAVCKRFAEIRSGTLVLFGIHLVGLPEHLTTQPTVRVDHASTSHETQSIFQLTSHAVAKDFSQGTSPKMIRGISLRLMGLIHNRRASALRETPEEKVQIFAT